MRRFHIPGDLLGGGETIKITKTKGTKIAQMPQELAFSFLFHICFACLSSFGRPCPVDLCVISKRGLQTIDQQQQQTNRVTPRHGGRRQYRRRCISKKRAKLLAAFPKS